MFLAEVGKVIYEMILIKAGWIILNTSLGFYESVKAGSDGSWTQISELPGATAVPAFCNIGAGDILLCTDGRYIWRSTIRRDWTLVCDQRSIGHRRLYKKMDSILDIGFQWTYGSPLTPAIAGPMVKFCALMVRSSPCLGIMVLLGMITILDRWLGF